MGATAVASSIGMPAIAAGKTIKIGAVQPFSGGLELFGNQAKMGLNLAVSEINAAGGGRIDRVEGWVSFNDCKGNLVVVVDRNCQAEQSYTTYQCRIPGVKNF